MAGSVVKVRLVIGAKDGRGRDVRSVRRTGGRDVAKVRAVNDFAMGVKAAVRRRGARNICNGLVCDGVSFHRWLVVGVYELGGVGRISCFIIFIIVVTCMT